MTTYPLLSSISQHDTDQTPSYNYTKRLFLGMGGHMSAMILLLWCYLALLVYIFCGSGSTSHIMHIFIEPTVMLQAYISYHCQKIIERTGILGSRGCGFGAASMSVYLAHVHPGANLTYLLLGKTRCY